MRELTTTFVSSPGRVTGHFDMDAAEIIGLVKINALAQERKPSNKHGN